ncbi:hypothetical protein V1L52_04200 [Treponema sp. HNW]|uniref:hypothetical protein n=1 Tax=Treponema sp. HNW TaxID=3116654 RepID=UPI003D13DF8D
MDKWEYLRGNSSFGSVTIGKKHYDWDELGQKGWELAGVFQTGDVIFKRRIPESPAPTQAQNTSRAPEVDMGLTF